MPLNIFEANFALGCQSQRFIMLMETANPTALHFLISLATSESWYILFITYGVSKIVPDPLNEALDRLNGEDIVSLLF